MALPREDFVQRRAALLCGWEKVGVEGPSPSRKQFMVRLLLWSWAQGVGVATAASKRIPDRWL